MSIKFNYSTDKSITIDQLKNYLDSTNISYSNREDLNSCALKLTELYNNRNFLADILIEELKNHNNIQSSNNYTSQVIIIESNKKYTIRANIWLPYANNLEEKKLYAYDNYHDHNFDLLTLGYFGPGYETILFEYDAEKTYGYIGEKVNINFKEKYTLKEGEILFLEKSKDIHLQCYPSEMSVSINIIMNEFSNKKSSQFEFDINDSSIKRILNNQSSKFLIELSSFFPSENLFEVIKTISVKNPYDYIRLSCFKTLLEMNKDSTTDILNYIRKDPSKLINSHYLKIVEQNN
ncbi:hypothetical protein QEJ31_08855 [Pigmentibacter sp. JX0631]|uniref:hypothetical protein n=1 Tax=Pigmentibacter sp. JX0631 TaxID=2976982 RepID=UPI0024688AAC|nr:hypothetical protein [Pigmentibacter sp. JX0631]WGL58643.1 hypothetical protein QEJ31_08855 [Pigmentibacter sp. JX0631]